MLRFYPKCHPKYMWRKGKYTQAKPARKPISEKRFRVERKRMPQAKLPTIAFVFDERLSRQRGAILTRIVNSIRQYAKIELISGKISEEELLKKLENAQYDLVLAPWYRYLAWSKIEGFYGLTRTSGPTFAGYFCESILPYELGEQADHYRAILLDFCNLDVAAIRLLMKSLLADARRTGILPLLSQG